MARDEWRRPVTIDGSEGEGGGQVLRSALALSMATERPFEIHRIRENRKRPGLLRQHLTCVSAASAISNASVRGAALGSRTLRFAPSRTRSGGHAFSIGSAGSAALVVQAVLPAVLAAGETVELTVEGGTHNPFAPPYPFLARSFLPVLDRLGYRAEVRLERHGFYPVGQGRLRANLLPGKHRAPLTLVETGELRALRAMAIVARLPRGIADRELAVVRETAGWEKARTEVLEVTDSAGPGNALVLEIEHANVTEVVTGFGKKGVRAEEVARRALREARRYRAAGAPVGEHLADQLLLPMALGPGGTFRTGRLSSHFTTNVRTLELFLGERVAVTERPDGSNEVVVSPDRADDADRPGSIRPR
jgi:RNA 3'-terminal phosphate cyclase (ATP)